MPEIAQTVDVAVFADIVRLAREKKGWSQSELASRIGRTANAISDIETGKTKRPHKPTLLSIARVMGFETWEQLGQWVGAFSRPHQVGDPEGGIPILSQIPAGTGDFENGGYEQGVG